MPFVCYKFEKRINSCKNNKKIARLLITRQLYLKFAYLVKLCKALKK
ncbi:hypothetical protein HMPREF3189_00314 [Clostridiales bacterium KA00134]|nr:hypothetical protein HMPREF3189_00314 [Clostridiales bacterium KA00134]